MITFFKENSFPIFIPFSPKELLQKQVMLKEKNPVILRRQDQLKESVYSALTKTASISKHPIKKKDDRKWIGEVEDAFDNELKGPSHSFPTSPAAVPLDSMQMIGAPPQTQGVKKQAKKKSINDLNIIIYNLFV